MKNILIVGGDSKLSNYLIPYLKKKKLVRYYPRLEKKMLKIKFI